jgi:antibiotic biosynthesis monooxygenase (ABM) superfamily enzyme
MNKKWQIDLKVIKRGENFSTMYKLFIAHQNNLTILTRSKIKILVITYVNEYLHIPSSNSLAHLWFDIYNIIIT